MRRLFFGLYTQEPIFHVLCSSCSMREPLVYLAIVVGCIWGGLCGIACRGGGIVLWKVDGVVMRCGFIGCLP